MGGVSGAICDMHGDGMSDDVTCLKQLGYRTKVIGANIQCMYNENFRGFRGLQIDHVIIITCHVRVLLYIVLVVVVAWVGDYRASCLT